MARKKILPSTSSKKKKVKKVKVEHDFRSNFEYRISEQIKSLNIPHTYETDKIPYTIPARESKYIPDFVFTKKDGTKMYVETKGRFLTMDRKKHLLIKQQHPELDIRILFQTPNNKLSKSSKTTYASWCEKHDIKYAKYPLPESWIKELL